MAADIYFAAQAARRIAVEANELAATAAGILHNIHSFTNRITRIESEGGYAGTERDCRNSFCESRNYVIGQWQRLTGRQWNNYGDNLVRA